MKLLLVLFAVGLCAALAWALSVWWWLGDRHTLPIPIGPQEIHGAQRVDVPLEVRPVVLERMRVPLLVDAGDEREPSEAEASGSRDPFERLRRDPPVVDGPKIESHYPSGAPEFRGTQVLDAHGEWVRDGPWTAWHENGQVLERGAYKDGVEDGAWNWWFEDGRPMAVGSWSEGARKGSWTFWRESGRLMMQGHYTGGVGDGLWTLFDENGYKQAEGPFEQGVAAGFWTVWNADGSLNEERTGHYENGQKVN